MDIDFEVEFTSLFVEGNKGTIELSANSYPFGGLDRFTQVIKAFGFTPVECFNGFDVFEYLWTSDYNYEAIILPEKTRTYLEKHNQ